jgi:hypothetical protein
LQTKKKATKPKLKNSLEFSFFHLVNFVIFRGLNFVNDAIVSTRKIREN